MLDLQGDIVERKDAARAYPARRLLGTAGRQALQDGTHPKRSATRSRADQSQAGIRPGAAGATGNNPVLSSFPERSRLRVPSAFAANAFAMQFHSLVALPLLLVAMTLIAATVSMRFARMGQSATMILGGIFAGFLLYVVSVLVKAFGKAGFVPPVVAAWFPVVVAMFFGVTFLLYKEDG